MFIGRFGLLLWDLLKRASKLSRQTYRDGKKKECDRTFASKDVANLFIMMNETVHTRLNEHR